MAATATGGTLVPLTASVASASKPRAVAGRQRSRKVSPEAGRAIEILGHAIEYLADEFALECMDRILGTHSEMHPRLLAIELLKSRNREIYLSCPEIPTWSERVSRWLRRSEA